MRGREALWRGAVVLAWVGGLWAMVAIDDDLSLAGGIALTVVAGILLDTWWVFAVPAVVTLVGFAIRYASDPSCSDCGEDPYDMQLYITAILFTLPATALMAIGVGARRAARLARRGSPPRARPVP
jgi:hypothetical protein